MLMNLIFTQKRKENNMNGKEFKKAVDLLHEEKGIDKATGKFVSGAVKRR